MFVIFFIAALSFIMGIGIKYFKWHFLISGYNTMSKDKKKNVDIDGLSKLMGNFLFLMSFILLFTGIMESLGYKLASLFAMMMIMPLTIILIIKAQKYDYNQKKKINKTGLIAVISIVFGIFVIISGFLIVATLNPKVELRAGKIEVGGLYKRDIAFDDIKSLSLEETMPEVINKTNGMNIGYSLRGSFKLKGEENSTIFVQQNSPPFIHIRTDDRLYIINFKEREMTIELYNRIKESIN
ncbi:MAG: DUF3784 domain-containing protein [Gudongella sp.]|nr:DUF3784 domain-containing protein [Gudongella sp.]